MDLRQRSKNHRFGIALALAAPSASNEDAMLRITVSNEPEALTFQLEGRLMGPWVQELEHCWRSTMDGPRPVIRFDLTGVTFVDEAGKQFLSARHAEGVQFVASGCLMRALVAEITGAPERSGRSCADQPVLRTNTSYKGEAHS
jgi:hypothetical protein